MSITSALVEQRLGEHGYAMVNRTTAHGVFEHNGDRVVVPHHSHELSPWAARVIEHSLEPRLGPRWLTDPSPPARTARGTGDDPPRRIRLHLVIRPEWDRTTWNAFVVEEPRILTFASTIRDAREQAEDAALAWFPVGTEIELVPVVQAGAAAQRWIDPSASAGTPEEARRHLRDLGFADVDIDELLGSSARAKVA